MYVSFQRPKSQPETSMDGDSRPISFSLIPGVQVNINAPNTRELDACLIRKINNIIMECTVDFISLLYHVQFN